MVEGRWRGPRAGCTTQSYRRRMSFDIYFLPRGVPWDESMEALEAAAEEDRILSEGELTSWGRVESRLRAILPNAELFVGEQSRELSDDETGIQLSQYGAEISLTVPYWYDGESADRIVERLVSICGAVEEETGLVGYDPQADEPFLSGGSFSATASFDNVRDAFEGEGVSLGRPAEPESQQGPIGGVIADAAKPKWWHRGRR